MKIVMMFLKKYWWVVLLFLAGLGFNVFSIFKRKPKSLSDASNEVLNQSTGFTTEKKLELNNTALQVANDLGTAYSWWNPRSWSENDKEVFLMLKPLTQREFDLVAKLYFQVYAKGRDLRMDLAKHLDSEYYEQLIVK